MDEPDDPHAADARTVALRRLGFLRRRRARLPPDEPGDLDAVRGRGATDQAGVGARRRPRRHDRPARRTVPRPASLRGGRAGAGTLTELRDAGNTVIAVEHDPTLIRAADDVIEIGPGPGRAGGRLVDLDSAAVGHPGGAATDASRSPHRDRRVPTEWMQVTGARENNLRGLDVRIPLGVRVGVCGVSGSGKSSLVVDTIALGLARPKTNVSGRRRDPRRARRSRGHLGCSRANDRRRPVPRRDHVTRHVPRAHRRSPQGFRRERSGQRAGHHDQGPQLRLRRLQRARARGSRTCRSCRR